VDDFFAKSGVTERCSNFRETADTIAKVALKMFLGITAEVGGWNAAGNCCTLVLPVRHPLAGSWATVAQRTVLDTSTSAVVFRVVPAHSVCV